LSETKRKSDKRWKTNRVGTSQARSFETEEQREERQETG